MEKLYLSLLAVVPAVLESSVSANNIKLYPFELNQVRFLDGSFRQALERNKKS
jgi:hypothetical protein